MRSVLARPGRNVGFGRNVRFSRRIFVLGGDSENRRETQRGCAVMRASNMSPIDRALWNVAEAASRYSDSVADAQRRKAWSDIEQTVAAARALFAQASAPAP